MPVIGESWCRPTRVPRAKSTRNMTEGFLPPTKSTPIGSTRDGSFAAGCVGPEASLAKAATARVGTPSNGRQLVPESDNAARERVMASVGLTGFIADTPGRWRSSTGWWVSWSVQITCRTRFVEESCERVQASCLDTESLPDPPAAFNLARSRTAHRHCEATMRSAREGVLRPGPEANGAGRLTAQLTATSCPSSHGHGPCGLRPRRIARARLSGAARAIPASSVSSGLPRTRRPD
jgi:hypothetical protein